jgi:hypothetical protein
MRTAMSGEAGVDGTLSIVNRLHRNSDGSEPFPPRGAGAGRCP